MDLRRKLARGINRIAEREQARLAATTFRDAAKLVHEEQKAGWKNGNHQAQWLNTLENYAFPDLGDLVVDKIDGPAIRDVLAKIWLSKPETARRVRQRIGTVLDWAYAKGLRPARRPCGRFPRDPEVTVHGFRSAFRDWVAESTNYPGEVAEAALAHATANKVEAAYKRTDFLQKRRSLMNE